MCAPLPPFPTKLHTTTPWCKLRRKKGSPGERIVESVERDGRGDPLDAELPDVVVGEEAEADLVHRMANHGPVMRHVELWRAYCPGLSIAKGLPGQWQTMQRWRRRPMSVPKSGAGKPHAQGARVSSGECLPPTLGGTKSVVPFLFRDEIRSPQVFFLQEKSHILCRQHARHETPAQNRDISISPWQADPLVALG